MAYSRRDEDKYTGERCLYAEFELNPNDGGELIRVGVTGSNLGDTVIDGVVLDFGTAESWIDPTAGFTIDGVLTVKLAKNGIVHDQGDDGAWDTKTVGEAMERNVLYRDVRLYVADTAGTQQIWEGRVMDAMADETTITLKCSAAELFWSDMPEDTIEHSNVSFDGAPDENIGRPVPIIYGDVKNTWEDFGEKSSEPGNTVFEDYRDELQQMGFVQSVVAGLEVGSDDTDERHYLLTGKDQTVYGVNTSVLHAYTYDSRVNMFCPWNASATNTVSTDPYIIGIDYKNYPAFAAIWPTYVQGSTNTVDPEYAVTRSFQQYASMDSSGCVTKWGFPSDNTPSFQNRDPDAGDEYVDLGVYVLCEGANGLLSDGTDQINIDIVERDGGASPWLSQQTKNCPAAGNVEVITHSWFNGPVDTSSLAGYCVRIDARGTSPGNGIQTAGADLYIYGVCIVAKFRPATSHSAWVPLNTPGSRAWARERSMFGGNLKVQKTYYNDIPMMYFECAGQEDDDEFENNAPDDVAENPVAILRYVLQDHAADDFGVAIEFETETETGHATWAYNPSTSSPDISHSAMKAREDWKFAFQITETTNIKNVVDSICEQAAISIFRKPNGKMGVVALLDSSEYPANGDYPDDSDNRTLSFLNDIHRGSAKMTLAPRSQIYNEYFVRYAYNPAKGVFTRTAWVTKDDSDDGYGNENTTRESDCSGAYNEIGHKQRLTIDANYIIDRDTAVALRDVLCKCLHDQRMRIEFIAGPWAYDLEPGHVIKLDSDWDTYWTALYNASGSAFADPKWRVIRRTIIPDGGAVFYKFMIEELL